MDAQDEVVVGQLRELAEKYPRVAHLVRPWWEQLEAGTIHRYEAVMCCLELFAGQHSQTVEQIEGLLMHVPPATFSLPVPNRAKVMERHLGPEVSALGWSTVPVQSGALTAAPVGRRKPRAVAVVSVPLPAMPPELPATGTDGERAMLSNAAVVEFGARLFDAAEPEVHEHPLTIWTDGSGTTQDSHAGIGVVFEDRGKVAGFGEYIGPGTNNVAELTAVRRALQVVRGQHRFRPITVYTDSQYTIGVLTKNWQTKANTDLILAVREELKHFAKLTFHHVPGHAGIEGNERADKLAGRAVQTKGVVRL